MMSLNRSRRMSLNLTGVKHMTCISGRTITKVLNNNMDENNLELPIMIMTLDYGATD